MVKLTWWMRIVGAFYLLQFVMMAIVRAPIRAMGPAGTLDLADAGDPLAKFLVDTWLVFGVEVGVIGAGLLVASRIASQARALVWTVIAIELVKGPPMDLYMISRGYPVTPMVVWIVIHSLVIATGVLALRSAGRTSSIPTKN